MSIHIGQRLPYKVDMDGQTIPLSGIEGEKQQMWDPQYIDGLKKRREKAKSDGRFKDCRP